MNKFDTRSPYPARLFLILVVFGCRAFLAAEESAPVEETPITNVDRDHWAYRPVVRRNLPAVERADWIRNPIDRFVLARLEDASISPLPQASQVTLIRRLTFDLLGLPPTLTAVEQFVDDESPCAYESLVDRLLASPQFGERWGQHWLDLARFSETDGFEHDKVRANAWRYRDWVIRALNEDMSYDQFVRLQLAGDELLPGHVDAKMATAFCLAGPDMPDINSQAERRDMLLNEMTSTVGSALLGLQIGCAQCHDHKYDPISQADFYRLRAIFEPAIQPNRDGQISTLGDSPPRPTPSFVMVRGDFRRLGARINPGFPRIANPWNDLVSEHSNGEAPSSRRTALANWITRDDHPLTVRVVVNRLWQHHFGSGLVSSSSDFGVMGSVPTHPELLDWLAAELVESNWSLKHIHRLIVTSATYRQASRVTEPGWTTSAREQAVLAWNQAAIVDPDHELLSRFPVRRLDGESIRDAMLAMSGALNPQAGGPGVIAPLPIELKETLLPDQWKTIADVSQHVRRSIYVFARRNLRYPVFDVFDRPDANASCARRSQSTTVNQSLLMLNSDFSLQMARRLAGSSLEHANGDFAGAIHNAVRSAFARQPTAEEIAVLMSFCDEHAEEFRRQARRTDELAVPLSSHNGPDIYRAAALTDLCLAVLNSNEFIYID